MAKSAQPPAGMEKAELRTHVKFARRQPVHIAFALGAEGKAVIMMDKRKQPRAVLKELKEQASDARNHRFGSMMFDEDNPKVARIVVDKAASGMARKLVVAFKGTGVRQIQLMTEDGQSFDSALNEEDEEDESDESPASDAQAEWQSDAELAPKPDGATPTAYRSNADSAKPEGDTNALKADLIGLVKRMMAAVKSDPSQKAGLAELATDAQASLKRGDLAQASAGIDVFREALDAVENPDPGATDSGAAEAKAGMPSDPDGTASASATDDGNPSSDDGNAASDEASAGPGAQAVQRYRKSRAVWQATRAKIDADIKKLSDTILSLDHGGALGDGLEQDFLNTIDPILSTLDDSLADILTAAEQAKNQDEAGQALDEARTTIGLYQNFVQSNGTIQELDQNPFTPLAVAKTLNASLQVLSAAMK